MKSRSKMTLEAKLRPGAGSHGDRRTKRNRDRSSQKRNAIKEQAA